MRLFIAINFPLEVKRKILRQVKKLKFQFPRVSWVRPANLHLTLKFLGYVNEDRSEEIKRGIELTSHDFHPFELTISKLGYFYREPFIIQLNVDESIELNSLVERIEKEMKKLRFRRENRPYNPHITLGRGRKLKREEVEQIKASIKDSALQEINFQVNQIVLFESKLTRKGSIYSEIAVFKT